MINITTQTRYNTNFINHVASIIAGDDSTGVSTGPRGTVIHLKDTASNAIQNAINTLFANINALPVVTDKASLTSDDSDTATITLVTAQSSIEYIVLKDGEEYSTGTVIPSAGTATLTLKTALAGTYEVILINPDGSATGKVSIIAT